MAGATRDAGVEISCPGCHETVLQKAMIPILAKGGPGIGYLCPPCARALIVPPPLASAGETDAEMEMDEPAGSS